MKRAVLADTGPLYAAADPDEEYHARAQRELKRLARDKTELYLQEFPMPGISRVLLITFEATRA